MHVVRGHASGSTLLCTLCGATITNPSSLHTPSFSRVTLGFSDWTLLGCISKVLTRLPDLEAVVHLEITRMQRSKVLLSVTRRPRALSEYTYALDTDCLAPVTPKTMFSE